MARLGSGVTADDLAAFQQHDHPVFTRAIAPMAYGQPAMTLRASRCSRRRNAAAAERRRWPLMNHLAIRRRSNCSQAGPH